MHKTCRNCSKTFSDDCASFCKYARRFAAIKSNGYKISEALKLYWLNRKKPKKIKGQRGGLRPNSGNKYRGVVLGIACDSSWEAAVLLYFHDQGIILERNYQAFTYEFNGKTHHYYPDFVKPDGSFIEVKGVIAPVDLAKWSYLTKIHHRKLIVIGPKRYKSIIVPFLVKKFKYNKSTRLCYDIYDDQILPKTQKPRCAVHKFLVANGVSESTIASATKHQSINEFVQRSISIVRKLKSVSCQHRSACSAASNIAVEHGLSNYMQVNRIAIGVFGLRLSKLLKVEPGDRKIVHGARVGAFELSTIIGAAKLDARSRLCTTKTRTRER